MNQPESFRMKLSRRTSVIVLIGIGVLMMLILALMGRVWWCQSGDWTPWSWNVWSPHNSQHFVDPYALSHVQHGIGLFLLLSLLTDRWLSVEWQTLAVAVVEATWEVAENTPWLINRYRESTASLDYFGDSIANSAADYVMCLAGVMLARKLSWPLAVGIFVAFEAISVLWIRDSLLLNILMLVCPIDSIKQWQTAIAPA